MCVGGAVDVLVGMTEGGHLLTDVLASTHVGRLVMEGGLPAV